MSACGPVPNPESTQQLLAKTAKGTGWVLGWRMATRLLGTGSTLVLVRALLPSDFGLVALATSLAAAVEGLAELGIQDALVRDAAPDKATYDTAFTLNLLRSIVTASAIALVAAPIAQFFAEARLAPVLWALAGATLLDGFANVGVVDFRRSFAFHKEFKLLVLPRLCSITLTVAIALTWQTYWALVAGIVSNRVLRIAAGYAMHGFRPRPGLRAWRHLIGYSSWTWAIAIASLLRDRADSFVIGRLLGPTFVGVYTMGAEIAALPTTELVEPLCRPAFSGFSEARRSDVPVGETYLRVVGTACLLTLPAGIGIALLAEPLVLVAFGARWLAAVPVVRIIGVVSIVAVFGYIAMVLLSAHAHLRSVFRAGVIGVVIRVGLLIGLSTRFGLTGAALGAACGIATEQGWLTLTALRRFELGLRDLLAHCWRPLLATGAMAVVLMLLPMTAADLGGLGRMLLLPCAEGALVYATVLLTIWNACGRPAGAEQDLLRLLSHAAGSLRALFAGAIGQRPLSAPD